MQVDLEQIITEGQIKLVLKTNTLLKLMRIFFKCTFHFPNVIEMYYFIVVGTGIMSLMWY